MNDARKLEIKKEFLNDLIDEFKSFAIDSLGQIPVDMPEDHFEYIEAAFEIFIDLKNNDEEGE